MSGGVTASGTDAQNCWRAAETAAWSWTLHCRCCRFYRTGTGWFTQHTHTTTNGEMCDGDLCCLGYWSSGWKCNSCAVPPQGHRSRLHRSCGHRRTLVRSNFKVFKDQNLHLTSAFIPGWNVPLFFQFQEFSQYTGGRRQTWGLQSSHDGTWGTHLHSQRPPVQPVSSTVSLPLLP